MTTLALCKVGHPRMTLLAMGTSTAKKSTPRLCALDLTLNRSERQITYVRSPLVLDVSHWQKGRTHAQGYE